MALKRGPTKPASGLTFAKPSILPGSAKAGLPRPSTGQRHQRACTRRPQRVASPIPCRGSHAMVPPQPCKPDRTDTSHQVHTQPCLARPPGLQHTRSLPSPTDLARVCLVSPPDRSAPVAHLCLRQHVPSENPTTTLCLEPAQVTSPATSCRRQASWFPALRHLQLASQLPSAWPHPEPSPASMPAYPLCKSCPLLHPHQLARRPVRLRDRTSRAVTSSAVPSQTKLLFPYPARAPCCRPSPISE